MADDDKAQVAEDQAPIYLVSTYSDVFYQVVDHPSKPRLFMWKGTGYMMAKTKSEGQRRFLLNKWTEILVRKVVIPTFLGDHMVYITKDDCTVTTAPIIGRETVDTIDLNCNPLEKNTGSSTCNMERRWNIGNSRNMASR